MLDVRTGHLEAPELDAAVAHVLKGGLIAHPTETVYGFGGLATTEGIEALRELKPGRDRPFLLLVPSADAVPQLAWTAEARELASVF